MEYLKAPAIATMFKEFNTAPVSKSPIITAMFKTFNVVPYTMERSNDFPWIDVCDQENLAKAKELFGNHGS